MVAEIFRGGLNSVAKGQFEAAQSQGFTFFQTLWYIVLPQAFRRIVPSLLSQVITTVKDTSFLAGFGVLEFFRSVQVVLSQSGGNKIAIFSLYVFAALGYFAVCFALSCVVRATQRGRNLPAAHAH
ncbi:putative glutamine ABC transporter permease protein GlnP [bioreactor metagenome]|uniref:Putative glutamine ABC transporter permease protein GlnP n=1 Tax=bioreactor metagenome TaxID=1076179 RepID=A0A645BLC6_9ZZZZ